MKSINFCFKNTGCPHKFGICQKQCSEAEKCLRAKRATCTKLTDFAPKYTANKFAVLDRENEIAKQNVRARLKKCC